MADNNAPLPQDPMSGYLTFDSLDDVRPNDQIEIRPTDSDNKHLYEIVSIRESNETYVYDHHTASLETFQKEEIKEILEKDNSYHRLILTRETTEVDDAPSDTLLFYVYAIENPEIPSDKRALQFGWAVESQNPLRDMPEFNEAVLALRWEDLREKVQPGGELDEFYDTFNQGASEVVDLAVSVGEFNARRLFKSEGEPTYDEELEKRIERNADSIEDVAEAQESAYL